MSSRLLLALKSAEEKRSLPRNAWGELSGVMVCQSRISQALMRVVGAGQMRRWLRARKESGSGWGLQGRLGRTAANMGWGRDGEGKGAEPRTVYLSYRGALLYSPDSVAEARRASPSGGSALSLYR